MRLTYGGSAQQAPVQTYAPERQDSDTIDQVEIMNAMKNQKVGARTLTKISNPQ